MAVWDGMVMQQGMIHIYHGDGKGKTTAAVGLAVRFAGSGGSVLVVQFLKNGTSGELNALRQMSGVEVLSCTKNLGFVSRMNEQQKTEAKKIWQQYFVRIKESVQTGNYQLLILDEILDAVNCEMVSLSELVEFLKQRPKNLEVVLTGRNPSKKLLEMADYITEMKNEKHPYAQGIKARKGVEY
jgi:cob(I)alamin adenosyltransferase